MDLPTAPELSVVITAFNVAAYIRDALQSALSQTLRHIEVIVVDDGSTDDTLAVIRSIHDPRIRLVARSHAGVIAAFNAGIALAQGEFIAFLDGDDVWHPDKLARHVRFLKDHPEIDLTFSWSRMIDEKGTETGLASRPWRGGLSFSQLLTDNVISNGSSVVLRREPFLRIAPYDCPLEACHDLDAWLRVALLRPGNIACVPAWLTYYRRRTGQITKDIGRMERGWQQVLETMMRLAPRETARVAAAARSNMARFYAYLAYENGNYFKAWAYLYRGFREAPLRFFLDLRNGKMMAATLSATVLPAPWHKRLLRVALLGR
jgi:glycosyltransferase involved in cell wall biosynthesis